MDPIGTADRLLGRAIERSMAAHHRHRLRRLGRLDALEPRQDVAPWCRDSPAPRDGCSIDVLIDGAEVLPAIAEAIRGARRSVRMAGWHLAPHFPIERWLSGEWLVTAWTTSDSTQHPLWHPVPDVYA